MCSLGVLGSDAACFPLGALRLRRFFGSGRRDRKLEGVTGFWGLGFKV